MSECVKYFVCNTHAGAVMMREFGVRSGQRDRRLFIAYVRVIRVFHIYHGDDAVVISSLSVAYIRVIRVFHNYHGNDAGVISSRSKSYWCAAFSLADSKQHSPDISPKIDPMPEKPDI